VRDHYAYDYAIIRVVPRVEREEFVNAGVILFCPAMKFLDARIELEEQRVLSIDPSADMESIRTHLATIPAICAGGVSAGPIGELPKRKRFEWLTAPRSTIIQTSPVHAGWCKEPGEALDSLLATMVRPPHADPGS
jgi:hypothetical protein